MSYLTSVCLIGAIAGVCCLINLLAQGVLLTKKMGYQWKDAIIPFASNIKLHNKLGLKSPNIVGIVLRIVGFIVAMSTLVIQYYVAQVAMSHIYGILLGYYEYTDYTTLWTILSYGSVLMFGCGLAARMVCMRKFTKMFSASKLLPLLGMFAPGLVMLILAFGKNYTFLLNKPVGQMSREEYDIYCSFAE